MYETETVSVMDNIYILGTHLENGEYVVKVGYTDNMSERLANDAGYGILFTFYSENAADIVKEIRDTLHTDNTPVYWYPAEYLNVIETMIKNKL